MGRRNSGSLELEEQQAGRTREIKITRNARACMTTFELRSGYNMVEEGRRWCQEVEIRDEDI